MFIYNFKINGTLILKIIFGIVIVIGIIFFAISAYRIFEASSTIQTDESIPPSDVSDIQTANYTNVLKAVHDNLDYYIGKKIHFTGYVYRVVDINSNQFILARDMIISSNLETLVVGFLCQSDKAIEFEDKVWVDIVGTITRGNYHGDIPVIKIETIQKVDKPAEEYVYPPDSSYVPTASIL